MATEDIDFDQAGACAVPAAQVVFANLEAPESPHGERGFQIAFHTQPELDLESIRVEIQPSLFYYRRSGYADPATLPPESVFFRTKSGRVVLIRITPMFDQFDIFGRPKTLFAHALVFNANDFRTGFQNDPFRVFDANPFYRSYEEVLERGGGERRNPQLARLLLPAKDLPSRGESESFQALRKNLPHLRLMLLLASHASNPRERRFTLQFDGPAGCLFDFMRDLMQLVPPLQRVVCSFDTLFLGDDGSSKASQSPHWANGVGTNQLLRQQGALRYDLKSGLFLGDTNEYKPETPYESWLDSVFVTGRMPSANTLRAAGALQELCWGRTAASAELGVISEEIFREFVQVNDAYIRRLLLKNLQKCPGTSLADQLLPKALAWISQAGATGLGQVTRRFPRAQFVTWLLPLYWDFLGARTPTSDELNSFENCLEQEDDAAQTNDDCRLFSCLLWIWRRDWKKLARETELLSSSPFERLVHHALRASQFQVEINVSIAPDTGALGAYTFVAPRTRSSQTLEITAALLGFALLVEPSINPAASSQVLSRVGRVEKQRWAVVIRALRILALDQDSWQLAEFAPLHLDLDSAAHRLEPPAREGVLNQPDLESLHPETRSINVPQIMGAYRWMSDRWELLGCWSSEKPSHVDEVLELLCCFPENRNRPVYVYFNLTVGTERRAVVAQITRISIGKVDPAIFIHALLPAMKTFERHFGADPFRLYSSGVFRTELPTADLSDRSLFHAIDPIQVPLATQAARVPQSDVDFAHLTKDAARLLLMLAAQAETNPQKYALCLLSDGVQERGVPTAKDLLQGLFAVLPPQLRKLCWFHTWFVNSTGKRTVTESPYWAIGMPASSEAEGKSDILFSLQQRDFLWDKAPPLPVGRSPFELWVELAAKEGIPADLNFIACVQEAYAYQVLCDGEESHIPDKPGRAYATFLNALRPTLAKRMENEFGPAFSVEFAPRLLHWLQMQHPRSLQSIGPWLVEVPGPRGFEVRWLCEWIVTTLLADVGEPTQAVLKGIDHLLRRSSGNSSARTLLELMRLRWLKDWHELAVTINKLDVDQYREFAQWCLKTLKTERGVPFQVHWLIQIDHRRRLQFGPMLKPSWPDDDAYIESRNLLAALLGRVTESTTYRSRNNPAPLKLETVHHSATRFLPDLLNVLHAYSSRGIGAGG